MKEKQLVNVLRAKKETISTMESCTAGYLATTITNVDNSSEVLKFSAITYSNEFKVKMGVDKKLLISIQFIVLMYQDKWLKQ